jgi:hypothetical protein
MEYIFLIYADPQERRELTKQELEQRTALHCGIMSDANARGIFRGASPLRPASTAITVRPTAEGGVTTTDGPFAETKEVVGGYYVLDCASDDEAKYWATRLAQTACATAVETRALAPMSEPMQRAARGETVLAAVNA